MDTDIAPAFRVTAASKPSSSAAGWPAAASSKGSAPAAVAPGDEVGVKKNAKLAENAELAENIEKNIEEEDVEKNAEHAENVENNM